MDLGSKRNACHSGGKLNFQHVNCGFNRLFLVLSLGWAIYWAIVYPLQRQFEGQIEAVSQHQKRYAICGQLPGSVSGAERRDCFDMADSNWKNTMEFYSFKRFYLWDVAFWRLLIPAIIVPPIVLYGLAALGVWIGHGFKPRASETE